MLPLLLWEIRFDLTQDARHGLHVLQRSREQSSYSGVWLFRMRIELNCAACGNNHFSLDQEMADSTRVRCRDCGHQIGTLAQLKEMVAAEVVRSSAVEEAAPNGANLHSASPGFGSPHSLSGDHTDLQRR